MANYMNSMNHNNGSQLRNIDNIQDKVVKMELFPTEDEKERAQNLVVSSIEIENIGTNYKKKETNFDYKQSLDPVLINSVQV